MSERTNSNLSLKFYAKTYAPILWRELLLDTPAEQYILRMMVKRPDSDFHIPLELRWLEKTILEAYEYMDYSKRFVYVTSRCGIVKSTTDDDWHVDGFSMRVPHVPEQNFIWSDCYPTEILDQQFVIPDDFDSMKHNLHHYFQDNAEENKAYSLQENYVHILDPYVIHRRPKVPEGTMRRMFRISFVPIEIEDDTCSQNSLLPSGPYGREDIRKSLHRIYKDMHGIQK